MPLASIAHTIAMPRFLTHPLRTRAALLALVAFVPVAAQASPGGFSLPLRTPTPTPAPAGPADERAGVAIPPRNVTPAPRIVPAPVPTEEANPSQITSPSQSPSQPAPRTAVTPTPTPQAATPAPTATALSPLPEGPPLPVLDQPAPTAPSASAPAAAPIAAPLTAPSKALGLPAFDYWRVAAGTAVLAILLGALMLRRRRKPAALRLAQPPETQNADVEPRLPPIDLTLDIPGATRSLRMFTLRYRLTLANRSDRAVNDLITTAQLTCARRGANNAVPVAAAQNSLSTGRIGPHQSRTVRGEVQLPLTAITPVMQGKTPLFIPILHVTIEGEGQQALAKSFVIGMPSGGEGRVQPLVMTGAPGAMPALKARLIDPPPTV